MTQEVVPPYYSVKEAVFPFIKFPGVDTILGPEMKSTGEVMGVGQTFGEAFVKSQLAAGVKLPTGGQGVHQRARTATRRGGARSRANCWNWVSACWPRAALPGARGGRDQRSTTVNKVAKAGRTWST